jgi:hypothetical protein
LVRHWVVKRFKKLGLLKGVAFWIWWWLCKHSTNSWLERNVSCFNYKSIIKIVANNLLSFQKCCMIIMVYGLKAINMTLGSIGGDIGVLILLHRPCGFAQTLMIDFFWRNNC